MLSDQTLELGTYEKKGKVPVHSLPNVWKEIQILVDFVNEILNFCMDTSYRITCLGTILLITCKSYHMIIENLLK